MDDLEAESLLILPRCLSLSLGNAGCHLSLVTIMHLTATCLWLFKRFVWYTLYC